MRNPTWTGDADFFQKCLRTQNTFVCHLAVERYPDDAWGNATWEWRVWPVLELRDGAALDRHGVCSSRKAAMQAASRIAKGIGAKLRQQQRIVALPQPPATRLAPAAAFRRPGAALPPPYARAGTAASIHRFADHA